MAQKLLIQRDDDEEIQLRFDWVDSDGEMFVEANKGDSIFINKQDAESIVSYLKQQFKL